MWCITSIGYGVEGGKGSLQKWHVYEYACGMRPGCASSHALLEQDQLPCLLHAVTAKSFCTCIECARTSVAFGCYPSCHTRVCLYSPLACLPQVRAARAHAYPTPTPLCLPPPPPPLSQQDRVCASAGMCTHARVQGRLRLDDQRPCVSLGPAFVVCIRLCDHSTPT